MELEEKLFSFASEEKFEKRKGPMCVALVITDRVRNEGLEEVKKSLLTEKGGQVKGLGKSSVQSILENYEITRVLAEEGGRTSRGSIHNAHVYIHFLESIHEQIGLSDKVLLDIESFWVDRVRDFFASKPFILRFGTASSVRSMIKNLLLQASERQKEYQGMTVLGTVLQHLVGAKLEIVSTQELDHHGASVADAPTSREGDFSLGDSVIHVTTSPTEALLRKCQTNINGGYRPWIVTIGGKVGMANGLAENIGIEEQVDVFDIEQFMTCNLFERGNFSIDGRKELLLEIVDRYNRIIEMCETDHGLKIRLN